MEPLNLTIQAYGVEEKTVAQNGKAAGRVYLPVAWVGKRVVVALLEPLDQDAPILDR